MEIELGARVRTSDGEEIGTIDRVILDPAGSAVRAVVVRRGFILVRDVEIPLEALEPGPRGEVLLTCTTAEVDRLPGLVEEHYTAAPAAQATGAGYPAGQTVRPAGAAALWREVETILSRQQVEQAVVGEGSVVRSRDGERIGEIGRLTFDEESGRPAELTIRRGGLFGEEVELPARLIASVDDGLVTLALPAAAFAAWAGLPAGGAVWSRDGLHLGTLRRRERDYLVVRSLDAMRWLRVPITAVDRLEEDRLVLAADAAEALRWDTLAGYAAAAGLAGAAD